MPPLASRDGARLYSIQSPPLSRLARMRLPGPAIVKIDIPQQVDIGLAGLALVVTEQIRSQGLVGDPLAVVGQRGPQAAAVGRPARARAGDELRRAAEQVVDVNLRAATNRVARQVRRLRYEGDISAVAADGGIVAGAVRLSA